MKTIYVTMYFNSMLLSSLLLACFMFQCGNMWYFLVFWAGFWFLFQNGGEIVRVCTQVLMDPLNIMLVRGLSTYGEAGCLLSRISTVWSPLRRDCVTRGWRALGLALAGWAWRCSGGGGDFRMFGISALRNSWVMDGMEGGGCCLVLMWDEQPDAGEVLFNIRGSSQKNIIGSGCLATALYLSRWRTSRWWSPARNRTPPPRMRRRRLHRRQPRRLRLRRSRQRAKWRRSMIKSPQRKVVQWPGIERAFWRFAPVTVQALLFASFCMFVLSCFSSCWCVFNANIGWGNRTFQGEEGRRDWSSDWS